MKYSNIIFNKELYDLQFSDLEQFFETNKEENLNLEFKSFVAKGEYSKKEDAVKKAVCGLLNSEGGIIIWGAPTEAKDEQGNTTAIGALTPFQSQLDKDRLINIFSSVITPMPIGIRVQVLKNEINESVFIIEVEKSIERPHQYDNRYHIRLDGQTRIAPHYLISALMKSVDFPVLRGHIRMKKIENDGNVFLIHFKKLLFNTSVYNNEKNINMRLIAMPGGIIVNDENQGASYSQTYPILSNGAPLLSNFILKVPANLIQNDIEIIFQFGGEKSPSKMSNYKYNISRNLIGGNIQNEEIYLIEKTENTMPSEVSDNSIDENINILLNQ